MIGLTALLLFQGAPGAISENEIVVIGNKLRTISVSVSENSRGWSCSTSASTGSEQLDEKLCQTATECVQKNPGVSASISVCIERAKPRLLDEYRENRESAEGAL